MFEIKITMVSVIRINFKLFKFATTSKIEIQVVQND